MNNIIMQKTTIRIGDGINSTIKKEVNVPVIPTCKTCNKLKYSLLFILLLLLFIFIKFYKILIFLSIIITIFKNIG